MTCQPAAGQPPGRRLATRKESIMKDKDKDDVKLTGKDESGKLDKILGRGSNPANK